MPPWANKKMLLKCVSIEGHIENPLECLLLGGCNYCELTIVKNSFVKFRDEHRTFFYEI